jgi:hypothetical protein
MFGGDLRVNIEAKNAEDVASARIKTTVYNQLLEDGNADEQFWDAGQDCITLGSGFLLDGFGSQYGLHPDTVAYGFDPSRTARDGRRIEYHDDIYDNKPYTIRVHPSNISFPAGTVRMEESHGFFIRYVRDIDDVREDSKLIKKHREQITPNGVLGQGNEENTSTNSRRHDQVFLWDWYDLRNNHKVTFAESFPYALYDEVDEILIRIDRLPLHHFNFNRSPRTIWSTSDFNLLQSLQQEINEARTIEMKTGRLQIFKGFYNEQMIDDPVKLDKLEKAVLKLTSDEIGALIGIDGDPNQFLAQFTPQQAYDASIRIEKVKEEIEEFGMSIGANQKGLMAPGRHTAYETKVTEQNADVALAPRRKKVAKILKDVVKNWSEMIYDFWLEPQLLKTYNAAGMPVVVEFKGADLRGEYRFNVSLEAMRSKSQEERVNEANMFLSQTMPFIQNGKIDPNVAYRQWATHALGSDWDVEALLSSQMAMQGQPVPFDQFKKEFMQQPQQPNMGQMLKIAGGMPGAGA